MNSVADQNHSAALTEYDDCSSVRKLMGYDVCLNEIRDLALERQWRMLLNSGRFDGADRMVVSR